MNRFRIGYYVEVDAEGVDAHDAANRFEDAYDWAGCGAPYWIGPHYMHRDRQGNSTSGRLMKARRLVTFPSPEGVITAEQDPERR